MSNEDPVTRLAIKVVNLRHALEMTNRILGEHGLMQLLCSEDAPPTFYEARTFWAEVRKVKASVLLDGQS